MKQNLIILAFILFCSLAAAQDTLTGWTFPTATGPDSLNANLGTIQNQGYDIRFEWTITPGNDSTVNTIFFHDEGGNLSAGTEGWDNGADTKFWSIKFKAPDYSNFKVYSKQKSSLSTPGPRDFKLQWRLSGGAYEDIPNGTVTVANDWTTGLVNNLPVPITGQGTSSVYIRWIMTSNIDINNGIVTAAGASMIDDILVTGQKSTGEDEILLTNRMAIYPNPNKGRFTVATTIPANMIRVTDANGKVFFSLTQPDMLQPINLGSVAPGAYFLLIKFTDTGMLVAGKIMVE
jgi:hypothetical protein